MGVVVLVGAACGDDGGSAGGSMSVADFCARVEDALREGLDAPDADELDEAVDEIRGAAARAPSAELREAGETLADARETLLDADEGEDALARLDAAEDAERSLDELCAGGTDEGEDVSTAGPDDLAEDEIDLAINEALQKLGRAGLSEIDISEATEILESLDAEEIVGLDAEDLQEVLGDASDLLEGLDLSGRGGPESGMDEAYADCNSDLEADGPGDNSGCDALYESCDEGNAAACNDLWKVAPIGSAYVRFAESCGGRSDEPAFGTC